MLGKILLFNTFQLLLSWDVKLYLLVKNLDDAFKISKFGKQSEVSSYCLFSLFKTQHNYHTRINSTFVVIGVKYDQDFYLSQFRKRQKVRLAFKKHRLVIVRMRIVQSANTSKLVARCCMTHLIRQKVTSVECEGGTDMCCDKVLSWCLR